jgi:hypothetical protein
MGLSETYSAEWIAQEMTHLSSDRLAPMEEIEQFAVPTAVASALDLVPDFFTQMLLCDMLGEIRSADTLGSLVAYLGSSDVRVRGSAADALGKVFGYATAPPDAAMRERALNALLVRWGAEQSEGVRATLVQTMALLDDRSVVPVLEDALTSPSRMVRKQARWGLDWLARRILPLAGHRVVQCVVDSDVVVITASDGSSIRIAQPFLFPDDDCDPVLPPSDDVDTLGEALDVVGLTMTKAVAYVDGRLSVDFSDGRSLELPSLDDPAIAEFTDQSSYWWDVRDAEGNVIAS